MMEDNNPAPVIQDNLCHRFCNTIRNNKIRSLVYTIMITAMSILSAHYIYFLIHPKIATIKPENHETDRFTHEKSSKNKEEHPKLDPEKLPEENLENEKEEKKETEKPKIKNSEKIIYLS